MATAWARGIALALLIATLAAASTVVSQTEDVGDGTALAGPGAWQATYATPTVVMTEGGSVVFQNLDIMRHDVVADHVHGPDDNFWCDGFPEGHCPAFWSPLITLQAETPVFGVEELEPGTYPFYCTLHGNMEGTLVVLPEA